MRNPLLSASLFAALLLPAACSESSDDTGPSNPAGASSGGTSSGGTSSGGTSSGGTSSGGTAGTGGTSGAGGANTGGASGRFYATNFDGSENPISEGGAWTNGGEVGLDWQNIVKDQGIGFGSGTSAGYDDCLAHLSGFAPNHYAEATVHAASGYSAPSSHEVELLLRFRITAHSARGYEVLNGWNGAYSQIVRWNGPLDDFTYLSTTGPGYGVLVEGDVIRATVVGSTITVYKNGAEVMQASDSTWSDGDPGIGMFIRPGAGAEPQAFCYTSFAAGDL